MNDTICLVFIGEPQAQKRHRHFQMKGTGQVRLYDPSSGDKADFLSVIQKNAPAELFTGPLMVDSYFYFKRPKSHYRTGANSHILKENAPEWHTGKPDRDNLDKFVLDSMKNVFWKDDSQVCAGVVWKKYSDNPRTEIFITPL